MVKDMAGYILAMRAVAVDHYVTVRRLVTGVRGLVSWLGTTRDPR